MKHRKKKAIKSRRIKSDILIKWNKIPKDKIEIKLNFKKYQKQNK
jgi:hypothetical protein